MRALTTPRRAGTRGQPERTKAAILRAAIAEFSAEGLAGARTDSIARAAKVNKALLYYYFQDKETLYGAALEQVFAGLYQRVSQVLELDLPPGEKLLAYVAAHFDYVASERGIGRLVQGELMRAGRGGSAHLDRIVQLYLRPLFQRLIEVTQDGIRRGEVRPCDPRQLVPSIIGVIVHYFIARPIVASVMDEDPLSPDLLAARRAAVLEFVAAAIAPRAPNSSTGVAL